jgi:phenylacetate-CoA ligase
MATEGLFAVSCHLGNLHLAEDSVFFELEPVGDGLVSPLVSCFRRDTQIMARYRMNDLLRLAPTPCACGSPLTAISEVVGRMDDTFEFSGALLTPDVMRDAVVQAHPDITDFRIVQTGEATVSLSLPLTCSEDAFTQASQALRAVFLNRQVHVNVTSERAQFALDTAQKLRRVRKDWPY